MRAFNEIARRWQLGDPLRAFSPTAKQATFIEAVLSRSYQECYFIAANRAGKTRVGAYLGARIARHGFPWAPDRPTSGWVVALDFPMSRESVQPLYFNNGFGREASFIPDYEIRRFDRQAQVLFLNNGSQIFFKSCEAGQSKFQGAGKDWVAKDEVIPKAIDDEIAIRVRAGAPLIQWSTCTLLPPEGKSGDVHWLYQTVVKPWKLGETKRHITNASIYDNPHLLRGEIERLEDRYPAGSLSRRIRLDGELLPGIGGSVVYPAFNHAIHTGELSIDDNYPVLWSWDFNVAPMVSLLCQLRGKKLFVIKEFFMDEGSIPEMCDLFRDTVQSAFPIRLYGDASGRALSHHSRASSYQLILNELGSRGYVVRVQVPEQNPPVVTRINTVNAALLSHQGRSSVIIDKGCTELIADLESVIYDRHNGIKKVALASDPYRLRTHLSDALGYLICRELPLQDYRHPAEAPLRIKQPAYQRH